MNKIIVGAVAIVTVGIGWFILNSENTFDYAVHIDQEVTRLENELAVLDTHIATSTLTTVQATAAKVRIIARLGTPSNAAFESKKFS